VRSAECGITPHPNPLVPQPRERERVVPRPRDSGAG
jgi:hypothetical protein